MSRVVLLALLLVCLDGAVTWYVTDQAATTVADIEARDGIVVVDDSELGAMHTFEIRRAAGDNGDRIRLGGVKWLPAIALALAAALFTSRADPALRRSMVMGVSLALAVWLAPRIVYSRELRVLESVFG